MKTSADFFFVVDFSLLFSLVSSALKNLLKAPTGVKDSFIHF